MRKPIISPSLLAADFGHLAEEMAVINRSDADWLHFDVMDGVFVPNISFGFPIMSAVREICNKPIDAHFMIVQPDRYIDMAAKAGAMMMTVHQEAVTHLNRVVHSIHEAGMKAGVALNPATPVSTLEDIIEELDLVLVMSVNPGFGAQKFIERSLVKVRKLRRMIEESGSKALIEVDGGVNGSTAPRLIEAGVDVLVSGSYIFGAPDPVKRIRELKSESLSKGE